MRRRKRARASSCETSARANEGSSLNQGRGTTAPATSLVSAASCRCFFFVRPSSFSALPRDEPPLRDARRAWARATPFTGDRPRGPGAVNATRMTRALRMSTASRAGRELLFPRTPKPRERPDLTRKTPPERQGLHWRSRLTTWWALPLGRWTRAGSSSRRMTNTSRTFTRIYRKTTGPPTKTGLRGCCS